MKLSESLLIQNHKMDLKIPSTGQKRVVIIGGGFGGIEVAKALKDQDVQIVLLDKHNYHCFQPLLYQVATGGLEPKYCISAQKVDAKYSERTFPLSRSAEH